MEKNDIITSIISKTRYKELSPLFSFLLDHGTPYAIIKGEPLSLLAYGSVGKRYSSDIDLLISLKNLKIVMPIIINLGFEIQDKNRFYQVLALSATHQTVPYFKIANGIKIEIDINHNLFWGEYTGPKVDLDTFLADTIEMDIYGCIIKTLPPVKAMVQLVLHHYKEMNSIYHLSVHNCINDKMFRDVYYLLKNNIVDITPEILYKVSSEYKILPYVFYVLYFTNLVVEGNQLEKYVEVLWTPEGAALLDYYGLNEKERKSWNVNFETRLEAENMYDLIKNDLTEADIDKLERNRRIFG